MDVWSFGKSLFFLFLFFSVKTKARLQRAHKAGEHIFGWYDVSCVYVCVGRMSLRLTRSNEISAACEYSVIIIHSNKVSVVCVCVRLVIAITIDFMWYGWLVLATMKISKFSDIENVCVRSRITKSKWIVCLDECRTSRCVSMNRCWRSVKLTQAKIADKFVLNRSRTKQKPVAFTRLLIGHFGGYSFCSFAFKMHFRNMAESLSNRCTM